MRQEGSDRKGANGRQSNQDKKVRRGGGKGQRRQRMRGRETKKSETKGMSKGCMNEV